MCKFNILLKISGSIAAYKSAYLASRLVQSGYHVQAVATPAALRFIGAATLEGLTGRPLLYDGFEEGKAMSHIDLVKWADLTVFAPATANTINKLAHGIADNLVTSLFLAHDWEKPYLIAPAMNTAMMLHPATQEALARLKSWGIVVLETGFGRLACGDEGYGKMPDPDKIVEMINRKLNPGNADGKSQIRKVLITAGGTREKIDAVRELSNISTGTTGLVIADYFISQRWDVTFLHAVGARIPNQECRKIHFTGFESLDKTLKQLLREEDYDSVIHTAAVSDFSAASVFVKGVEYSAPFIGKIDSHSDELIIRLTKNHKILNLIKRETGEKKPLLVAFKFTAGADETAVRETIANMKQESGADLVVWNDANSRTTGQQTNFHIFSDADIAPEFCPEAGILAVRLEQLLSEIINKKQNDTLH
jgi:phosphopantothenoylcysteine decarboxylase/phosphopantothenate--cysteine ligase